MTVKRAPTEEANAATSGLDLLETAALVETILADQRVAIEAVLEQKLAIAAAVDAIAARMLRGGSLRYVGAGTSGRLGALDAAEMTPTFGTAPELVRAHVAGGEEALIRAVEGAEDDGDAGAAAIHDVTEDDAVVGISASGSAAFVVSAVKAARALGAYTLALTSARDSAVVHAAQLAIVFETGPEVIAGSTRLKAGTAQKIALSALSTAVMVRLGKVYDNLMVDLVANNRKLRDRALRLVRDIANVSDRRAHELLAAADGQVKVAIVMERRGVDAMAARQQLERRGGALRKLI